MYKVPGRSIVCDTPLAWLREVIWCYVVMKVFKDDIDAITGYKNFPGYGEIKNDANT